MVALCWPHPAPKAPLQGTAGPRSQDGGASPRGHPGEGRANTAWQGDGEGSGVRSGAVQTARGEEESGNVVTQVPEPIFPFSPQRDHWKRYLLAAHG